MAKNSKRRGALRSLPVAVVFFLLLGTGWSQSERERILTLAEQASSVAATNPLKALEKFDEALKLAENADEPLLAAGIEGLLGETLEDRGDSQDALSQYEMGLRTLAEDPELGWVRELIANLSAGSKVYTGGSNSVSSDHYRARIGSLLPLIGQSSSRSKARLAIKLSVNAANMYLLQEQYPAADSLYQKAHAAAQKEGATELLDLIAANQGWSAVRQNNFETAEKLLTPLVGGDGGLLVAMRRALLALAVNFRETGQLDRALVEMKRAVKLYESTDDPPGLNRARAHLATLHFRRGELAEAEEIYQIVLQHNEALRENAVSWMANGGLARVYREQGELENALLHYEAYLGVVDRVSESWRTDEGRVSFLENQSAIFQDYIETAVDLAMATGDFSQARTAIEKGRSRALGGLLSSRARRFEKGQGSLPAGPTLAGDEWFMLENQLSDSDPGNMFAQTVPGVVTRTKRDVDSQLNLLDQVSRKNLKSSKTQAEFSGSLATQEDPLLLEYFVLKDRTVILVKSPDGSIHGAILPVGAEELHHALTRFRTTLGIQDARGVSLDGADPSSVDGPSPSEEARQLYRWLVAPVAQLFPDNPEKTLVVVPHGALWMLPFAALIDEDGRFLYERHVLIYAPSETIWRKLGETPRPGDHSSARAWVAGNPVMPAAVRACGETYRLASLPGAEAEAEAISGLFLEQGRPVEFFAGLAADRLRLEAWHGQYSVLHLATHGVACPDDPLDSFLVLSSLGKDSLRLDQTAGTLATTVDSRLPIQLAGLHEILENPRFPGFPELTYPGTLDARTIINDFQLMADLVTLSACQTGLGRISNEGMIGFSRAFLAAGARSTLLSLWRVDDQSTMKLMVEFYREYLKHGKKGLALREAMSKTRSVYSHPKYWAAFSLLGLNQ